jgi:hypothetical protein
MGITISYRGAIASLDRVEDFEDRVLDFALELGGQAHIWRTASDKDPSRVVRGVILDLCPGQETTSLLISPEGWLIGLTDIEDAEESKLETMPWCFVKTQFGTLEGHVALVEMFTALKAEFFPGLEVRDEGDYWETRDVDALARKLAFLQAAIRQFRGAIQQHGLTPEAAEDPEILATRLARIAHLVQQTLKRPSEHPPVHWEDGDSPLDHEGRLTPEEEARWDASFKENRRMQERVQRAIEKHRSQGAELDEAFDAAMREETSAGLPAEPDEDEDHEDWRDSLPEEGPGDALAEEGSAEDDEFSGDEFSGGEFTDDEFSDDGFDAADRHPLQQRASDLLLRLHALLPRETESSGSVGVLMTGACEISGGLAQALGLAHDGFAAGLCVVQLKRALRGAAFALGALFPLSADRVIDENAFQELYAALEALQGDIYDELRRCRGT